MVGKHESVHRLEEDGLRFLLGINDTTVVAALDKVVNSSHGCVG